MPANIRTKTKYPGVYYIMGISVEGKPEKIYYIRYRRDGELIEEKAGRQTQNNMTPAKANSIRNDRIKGNEPSNKAKREAEAAAKKSEESKWTIQKLSEEYFKGRPDGKSRNTDQGRYDNYLKSEFGEKEPIEIAPLDVDRLRIRLSKKLKPQTVTHILNLLIWITNYGAANNLSAALPFKVKKPKVDNKKTEFLSPDELKRYLAAIEADTDPQVRGTMKLALFTGMRRSEILKLRWRDIDFERGFITIRNPKGGQEENVPMNDDARNVLKSIGRSRSPYVFPGRRKGHRVDIKNGISRIRKAANLPKGFRPLHGLRHQFASMLASSGQVDMYTLQKLLTHKDPRMTQRYSHLRDETLKKASGLAGTLVGEAVAEKTEKNKKKVVNLEDHTQ
jgi:integrase